MRTSRTGIELIKAHEGLRLDAYLCPAGVPTIGYGHTHGVKMGDVGAGNFRSSTLLKRLKSNPNDPDIANQFKLWVYGGGKVLPVLVRRRNEEAKLYFT